MVFADDTHPRWLTAVAQLDYDTMAGTDKFGNMFIARLPADVSATIENDPSGAKVRRLGFTRVSSCRPALCESRSHRLGAALWTPS